MYIRYHQGQLYVIDVSQSVEYDHPNALEFLRKDCVNVNSYFRRRLGVAVMTGKELFDFITDLSISDDNIDDYLATLMKTVSERSRDDVSRLEAEEEVNKHEYAVFYNFIITVYLTRSTDAVDQWCLQRLLGMKWHRFSS